MYRGISGHWGLLGSVGAILEVSGGIRGGGVYWGWQGL